MIRNVTFMRNVLLLFILNLSVYSVEAQVKTFTLDEAVFTAVENNSDSKIAVMEVRKAQAGVDKSNSYILPSVGLSANYSHFFNKPRLAFPLFNGVQTTGTAIEPYLLSNYYEAKIEVQQIIYNPAVYKNIDASSKKYQTSREMVNSKVSGIVTDVKKSYYKILLAKEEIKLAKLSLENYERHLSHVRALFDKGVAAEYNVLQAEVQVENYKPEVIEAENNYKNATESLKMLLKIDKDTQIDAEGELEYSEKQFPEANELINNANKNNPEIKSLKLKIETAEAFTEVNRAEWMPALSAFGNYSFNGMADDFQFNNYNQSAIGLALSMSLFNGFGTKYGVQQSEIDKMQTEEELVSLKNRTILQIKTQLNELDRIRQNLTASEKNIQLAEKAAKIANTGFSNGTRTQLEVLTAETQLRQALTNRIKWVYAYNIAVTEIDGLTGNINQEYLQKVMSDEENR